MVGATRRTVFSSALLVLSNTNTLSQTIFSGQTVRNFFQDVRYIGFECRIFIHEDGIWRGIMPQMAAEQPQQQRLLRISDAFLSQIPGFVALQAERIIADPANTRIQRAGGLPQVLTIGRTFRARPPSERLHDLHIFLDIFLQFDRVQNQSRTAVNSDVFSIVSASLRRDSLSPSNITLQPLTFRDNFQESNLEDFLRQRIVSGLQWALSGTRR